LAKANLTHENFGKIMKPTSPWSVKGVEPEAREAAKLAARRAGVPLGVWLGHTIRKVAAEQLKFGDHNNNFDPATSEPPSAPQANYQAPPQADYQTASQPYPQEAPPRPAQPPAPTTEAVLQSITRLASKIEESDKRTTEILVPLAEKVKTLTEQVNEVKENKSIESNPLERALSRMSERLDQIEDGPKRAPASKGKPGFISRLFSD
jgi:localization factor PodJL